MRSRSSPKGKPHRVVQPGRREGDDQTAHGLRERAGGPVAPIAVERRAVRYPTTASDRSVTEPSARRTRRRVAGAASLAIALAAIAVARGLLTHPPVTPRPTARGSSPPAIVIGHAHGAYLPAADDAEPLFILVLGSDARPGETVERARSDAIHIVGVD